MCTLIALHRCASDAPLVVAANRDEFLDRPAAAPALRETPGGPVLAPQDLRAGGTWLGLGASGVFAALTNRPCAQPDSRRRSRGLLVLDALAHGTAAASAAALEVLPARSYNPFNLFVADALDAFVVVYDEAPKVFALRPGVHVIGNTDPDSRASAKVSRLLDQAEQAAGLPSPRRVEALAEICRSHDGGGPPLDDTCIHTQFGANPYGTRSSTLIELSMIPARSLWLTSDGPPCRTPYQDFTSLVHALEPSDRGTAGDPHARSNL